MTDTILPNGCKETPVVENGYFKKGCNPLAQTGRSKLQNQRAELNQQIIKQMRMRAGAENLLRATSNNKVREMVLLELSYVNSNLQLLAEQLEGLNSSVEVYQDPQEMSNIPLIPLGLKETKDVDFSVPFKDFILEHYSEDGSNFDEEIADLMDLRRACRTPSRNSSDSSLPGMTPSPVCPCANRTSHWRGPACFSTWPLSTLRLGPDVTGRRATGLEDAITAFQKGAGVLNYLKETFTHTPSYDMSPAMLSMLIKLLLAQAQECLFEKAALLGIRNEFLSLLRMAQEAAKVGDTYDFLHQSMIQTPIKDHVPFFWSTMSQVKTNHYCSLAHYFMATALLDHELTHKDDEDEQEKTLSQLYDAMPEDCTPLDILRKKGQRLRIGKAHLRKAILGHEEALRIHSLCRHLRKLDVLREILQASNQRSLAKLTENESEDEFTDYMEAPNIIAKTDLKAEMELPVSTKVKVKDFFHKLGPLSVFSAKQRWTAPRTVRVRTEDRDLGFTLKGDAPVQVQCLDPLCSAAEEGLKEGDYIVAVGDTDCKWMSLSEVMKLLKDVDEEGVDIRVVSLMDSNLSLPAKSATYCGLPKTYSMICLDFDEDEKGVKTRKVGKKMSFLNWGLKNKHKSVSTLSLPTSDYSSTLPRTKPSSTFSHTAEASALY
ncbi:hypothetical protein GJAV_G00229890 [Gymnothorax javanicus]|nr:hypothetical protein GJAV_G00229890 [Gymnothorax javanicus]